MKSQVKIYKDDISEFYAFLNNHSGDIEVNTEVVGWRWLMWRSKGVNNWTQAYDGMTRSGKSSRDFVRVFGPDEGLVAEFYKEKNND